jgi:hypothetical protein
MNLEKMIILWFLGLSIINYFLIGQLHFTGIGRIIATLIISAAELYLILNPDFFKDPLNNLFLSAFIIVLLFSIPRKNVDIDYDDKEISYKETSSKFIFISNKIEKTINIKDIKNHEYVFEIGKYSRMSQWIPGYVVSKDYYFKDDSKIIITLNSNEKIILNLYGMDNDIGREYVKEDQIKNFQNNDLTRFIDTFKKNIETHKKI